MRNKTFGERLAARRELRDLDQEELGLASNINARTISDLESGIRHPTLVELKKLVEALDASGEVDVRDLLDL